MEDYAIWLACERFSIKPPGVVDSWDNCSVDAQANLIAYSQIREIEGQETLSRTFKGLFG